MRNYITQLLIGFALAAIGVSLFGGVGFAIIIWVVAALVWAAVAIIDFRQGRA